MKWLKRFWRQRKQDDRIKILLIFLFIGIGFLAHAVYSGIQAYHMAKSPIEYVVTVNGEWTPRLLEALESIDGVGAASRQKASSLVLTDVMGEMTVNCLELSEDYLKIAYGISGNSGMKVIYLNELAYTQFLQVMGKDLSSSTDFKVDYQIDGEEGEQGTARILPAPDGVPEDTACAFCAADSVRLSTDENPVRLWLEQQDFDGIYLEQLKQLGLEVNNSTDVEQNTLKQKIQFLMIRYDIFIGVLCFLIIMNNLKNNFRNY